MKGLINRSHHFVHYCFTEKTSELVIVENINDFRIMLSERSGKHSRMSAIAATKMSARDFRRGTVL